MLPVLTPLLLLFLGTFTLANGAVVSLTSTNFDFHTAGKNVFVKFFAPWCGHCKAMAPDWEQLASDYEGSSTTLIAECDCTEQPDVCQNFEVSGYPTLLYGQGSDLEDYEGGRDYDSLKEFVDENLSKPTCSIHNLGVCTKEEKDAIAALQRKSTRELHELVNEFEKEAEEAEALFQAEIEKIEELYDQAVKALHKKLDDLKKEKQYSHVMALIAKMEDEEEL